MQEPGKHCFDMEQFAPLDPPRDIGRSPKGSAASSTSVSSEDVSLDSLHQLEALSKEGVFQPTVGKSRISYPISEYESEERCELARSCINTIRFLCVDTINLANSGHPGICMGMAPASFVLFDEHMRFCPSNPSWINRDRFILSAGHGSMLLYSLLHLYGYKSVSLDDIKRFRKLNSRTPGHPECTETPGVEVSTGPLGQGLSNAVGIALSEAHLASVYNRPGFPIVDNFTFCIAGDGCMMEGMTSEACSLAGHLGLGKLIVLYDDNHISIDGSTDLAFTEDVGKRFEAYNWQVIHVERGNTDITAIDRAIRDAKRCVDKPTLIKITTTIGYGAPSKSNTAKAHGSAIGAEETSAAREALNYKHAPFDVPQDVLNHFRRKIDRGNSDEQQWKNLLREYEGFYPELHKSFKKFVIDGSFPEELMQNLQSVGLQESGNSLATRKHSKTMLNTIASLLPTFLGGSADTSPSTLTDLKCSRDFTKHTRDGRIIRFGVREHAMGAIANGIALAGYNLRPFCSTFLAFSDYMRGAMRMASLSNACTLFVMTHDSVGLGEDGPSHQPIEHIASLRAMPNHDVWRPADGLETAAAYASALESKTRPSTLVLSRQTTKALQCTDYQGAQRGGYVVEWNNLESNEEFDGLIMASGSELSLAVDAARELLEENDINVRVVSMLCWEQFERQGHEYKEKVWGAVDRERRVAVEAASSFGWERWVGGGVVGVDEYGRSGSGADVLEWFGISVERVKKTMTNAIRLGSVN